MSMISSASLTVSAPTTLPVFSLVFMVMMPLPPRDWLAVFAKIGAFADAVFAGHQQGGVRHHHGQGDDGVGWLPG